jgi:ABC-type amino acid transport substrate-binding protein
MPRDPERTTERVEGHVLRAGVSSNPPWIRVENDRVEGVEADLIRGLAGQLHAEVRWIPGGETALFAALKQHQLDLVAGGVTTESPWTKELGATLPFAEAGGRKHVLIAAAGENRWLLTLDRYLHDHKPAVGP